MRPGAPVSSRRRRALLPGLLAAALGLASCAGFKEAVTGGSGAAPVAPPPGPVRLAPVERFGPNDPQSRDLAVPGSVAGRMTELFVVDQARGLLLRIDRFSLEPARVVARGVDPNAQVWVEPRRGDLLLAEPDRGRVRRLGVDGRVVAEFSTGLVRPLEAALAGFPESVWVVDDGNGRIAGFAATGGPIRRLGGLGGLAFPDAGFFALATGGELLVVLGRAGGLWQLDPDAERLYELVPGTPPGVHRVAVDSCGRLFTGTLAGGLHVLETDGWRSLDLDVGRLSDLYAGDGELFVADGAEGRVAVYRIEPRCR